MNKKILLVFLTLSLAAYCSCTLLDTLDLDTQDNLNTDSEPALTDLCDNYPASNNNFKVGSVIRNYTMYDKSDTLVKMCELGGGNHYKLMLFVVSASW